MSALALARIAAVATDPAIDRDIVDAMVARWLGATGRLAPVDGASQEIQGALAALPGWCGRAAAAERLFMALLPGWRFDPCRGSGATIRPQPGSPAADRLADAGLADGVACSGPSIARALIAATFTALFALEPDTAPREVAHA